MRMKWSLPALLAVAAVSLTGCFGKSAPTMSTVAQSDNHNVHAAAPTADKSVSEPMAPLQVDIRGTKGEKLGTAVLTQFADGLKVSVEASGFTPGAHGFHFHETGKCEAPDFKTAGSHFNPSGKKHGFLTPEGPHVGDLPNVQADASGKIKTEFVTRLVTLEKGKPHSLLKADGTSIVIHEKGDDYLTDPAGNSGNRLACGVIKG